LNEDTDSLEEKLNFKLFAWAFGDFTAQVQQKQSGRVD